MVRVLLISHIHPPSVDGGSRVIVKFAEFLKSQGHEVYFLTSNANSTDDFTQKYTSKNFNDYLYPVFRLTVNTFLHQPLKQLSKLFPSVLTFSKGPIFHFLPFLKFLKYYYHHPPDWIIAGPLPTTIIIYAVILQKLSSIIHQKFPKLLINASFHHNDHEFFNPFLIACMKKANFIWTQTNFESKFLKSHFQIPSSKIVTLGNGIDQKLISKKRISSSTPKKINLLFIGSFAAHKNIETLLRAFHYLNHHSPKNFTLTLAGKATLHHLFIPQNVKIILNFPDSQLARIIDSCQILISPSLQESYGLVLLEAMARGKPVIAADIPTSAEIVHQSRAGVLFKANDHQDLAQKILYLSKINVANKFAANGIAFSKQHTWDKINQQLCQKISL